MTAVAELVNALIGGGMDAAAAAALVARAVIEATPTRDAPDMGWEKTRLFVLQRDNHTCAYCGGEAGEIDHVYPRVLGGTNHPGNLVAACRSCNAGKGGNAPVTAFPSLSITRSRKAINQANYRARKSAQKPATIGESVALAAIPESAQRPVTPPATPGNASDNGVISAPLSILPSFQLSQENPKEVFKEVVRSTEPRARAKRGDRGARMTDDWRPDDKGMKFAGDFGLRLYEIENEITKFRNYWINRTDRDASKPRWDLAWQNWILNVRKAPNGQGQSVVAAADRLLEDVRALSRPAPPELELLQPGVRGGEGAVDVRLLSQGRRE